MSQNIHFQDFSIGYQNIHGLHDSLGSCKAKHLEIDLSNDIEILTEIWGCECELKFDDYTIEIIKPQKHIGITKGRIFDFDKKISI